MRKFTCILLTVALSFALLLPAIAEPQKELTIWFEKSFNDEANATVENRVKEFAKLHGIKVNYEAIAATDYMLKLNAAIEAKTVPDITFANKYKVLNYYPNNPYMDVTDLVDEVSKDRKMFSSVINATKIGDQNYFVPFHASSTIMFVRKDILDAKGIALPTTWAEVFDVAEKVSDPSKGIYGLGMGCGPMDEDAENTFRMIMWSNGGSIFDEEGKPIINDSVPTKELVEKYISLFQAGAIPSSAPSWDPGGNNKSYLMGESAMVFNAPTLYNALKNDPAYADIFSNTVFLAPPKGTKEATTLSFVYGWAIMEGSKSVDLSKDFIRYMYENDWYDAYFQSVVPVFAPIFEDSAELPLYADGINAQVLEYVRSANGYYGYPAKNVEGIAVGAKYYYTYPVAKMLNSVVNKTPIDEAFSNMTMDIEDVWSVIK